jgi:site-specific recombinase XerD
MNEIEIKINDNLLKNIDIPLDRNPAAVYLSTLKPTGRRGAKQALELISGILTNGTMDMMSLKWQDLRFQHTSAVRSKLAESYKPATVNHALSALRGVLRASWQLQLMTAEGYHLAAAVKSVKGSTIPAGRELQSGELAALMISCENDNSPAGVRDAAIIALMYSCGLRREEVTTLNINDYEPSKGKLIVKGKGSKERTAYLTNGALDAITDWLQVRGNDPGGMFVSINKSGKLNTERFLTPQAIYNLLIKRASQASVKEFSPHDLRRTFVSDLLDAGADIATVAKMAGHASVNTTARYDRRPEEAKKKAAGLLHIPYIKR